MTLIQYCFISVLANVTMKICNNKLCSGLIVLVLIATTEGLVDTIIENSGEGSSESNITINLSDRESDLPVTQSQIGDVHPVTKFIKEFQREFEKEQLAEESPQDDPGLSLSNSTVNGTVNATESTEEASNTTSSLVSCITSKNQEFQPVELVNSTRLLNLLITESNVTNRRSLADCVTLLFYARYCPFSSMAAPHFNALARAFPDIKMAAVDAMKHHSFNTQYGIVGVPTIMLFHNGRPAAKFNDSEYTLEMFARFITKYTGLEPQHKLYVTSADFGGPVSSVPTKETDYCLILSWAFIFVCAVYFFSKSAWWRWIVETVQNTWREAEAQHEHGD